MENSDKYKKYVERIDKLGVANIGGGHVNIDTLNLWSQQSSRSSHPTDIPNNVPRSSVEKFLGREEQLKQLHKELTQSRLVPPIALSGAGGIGKTELAIQYALKNRKEYPGGICWLLAREKKVGAQILNFARSYLGIEPPKEQEERSQLDFCWSHWQEGNVLLIFDDVTDFYRIKENFPPAQPRFKVLITTRIKYQAGITPLDIEVLTEPVALELLKSYLVEGDSRVDEEMNWAKKLCRWLDYLPLGLELVGRYLARKQDLSLLTMFERLENEKLHQQAINEGRGIAAAFELSWQELSQEAQELSYFLSLFALAPIPWWLVEYLQEHQPEDIEKLRDDWLLKFSLLQRKGNSLYQFHHLVREFVQAKLSEFDEVTALKKNFCSEMTNLLEQLFNNEAPAGAETTPLELFIAHLEEMATVLSYLMDEGQLFTSHISLLSVYIGKGFCTPAAYWGEKCESEMTSRFGREHPFVPINLYMLVTVYSMQGSLKKAEQNLREIIELWKKVFGERDLFLATVFKTLASLLIPQGYLDEAEERCRQAIEIEQEHLGDDNPQFAESLCILANICQSRGQYQEAENLYEQAFNIEDFLTNKPSSTAMYFLSCSSLYIMQGRTQHAEKLEENAKEIIENTFGKEHPFYAVCLTNLGTTYLLQGRHQDAEICSKEAIEINEAKNITEHPTHAANLANLAVVYMAQGRHDEAATCYQRALEIRQQVFGQQNQYVADSLVCQGINYVVQGKYEKAEPLLIRGQEMLKLTIGTNHPQYAEILYALSDIYFARKEYQKVEELLRESVSSAKQSWGNNHPKLSQKLSRLAYFLVNQERYEEAEELFQSSLKIDKEVFGEDNPNVCQSMLSIAEVYQSSGREAEADSWYAKAIGIYEQDDSINPDFSEGLIKLIELYESQHRYEEAEALYARLLKTSRTLLGNEHPTVVKILNKLARLRIEEFHYQDAANLYEETLEIRKKIFNEKHPILATNMVNLAYVYRRLERLDEAQELYLQALDIRINEYGSSHHQVRLVQEALVDLDVASKKRDETGRKKPVEDNPDKIETTTKESESAPKKEERSTQPKEPNQEVSRKPKTEKLSISKENNSSSTETPAKKSELFIKEEEADISEIVGTEELQREIAHQSEIAKQKVLEIENLEEQKAALKANLEKLEEQKTGLKADLDKLKRQKTKLETDLDKFERQKAELETNLVKIEGQKVELETDLVNLEQQQNSLETELKNCDRQHQSQQTGILTVANKLIQLTREEREKLSEPLQVVLADLQQEREGYQLEWEQLQTAIQQFNQYKEETDEISFHLDTHYQANRALAQRLPLDKEKVHRIMKAIRTNLEELDKELAKAHKQHEQSQQKEIITF